MPVWAIHSSLNPGPLVPLQLKSALAIGDENRWELGLGTRGFSLRCKITHAFSSLPGPFKQLETH